MRFFRRKRDSDRLKDVHSIDKAVLKMIFAASKETYPREFMGLLRAEKGVITELILLPGTTSGDSHAIFYRHMLPIDFSIIGTAHSHPSSSPNPSKADKHLFQRYGRVHIISARPYSIKTWKAYDHKGMERELRVI